MNRITVDEKYCKGCHLCIDQCEKGVLAVSNNRNAKGYLTPEAVDSDKCIRCLRCELICPDMAIEVEESEDAK